MESYIVRIYRREEQGDSTVRGLVEKVGAVSQDAFGTKEELWNILSIAEKSRKRGKNPVLQKRKVNKKQHGYVP
jgi:hypothetical protein